MEAPGWAVVGYSRAPAVADRAVLPVTFGALDCQATWSEAVGTGEGEGVAVGPPSSSHPTETMRPALFTALLWADRVYLQARIEEQAECMLVLIGATPEGRKELVGFQISVGKAPRAGGNCWSTSTARIAFCETLGLDYVSCSPFRVPIARLTAAHAAIEAKSGASNEKHRTV